MIFEDLRTFVNYLGERGESLKSIEEELDPKFEVSAGRIKGKD